MELDNLKDTLKRLQASLETSAKADSELRDLLRVLDNDIHLLLGKEAYDSSKAAGLAERAQFISARFAAQHPHIDPILRELVDILTGMGV
ncbi:MAG TPA: DUF4404 family protein [Terriglobia bacterium]|nr:DUF4404 family protein [Terriglobia bacterium]